MREERVSYSEVISKELSEERQKLKILELQLESFVHTNQPTDRIELAHEMIAKQRKLISEYECELKSAGASYITEELIRARATDLQSGIPYSELIQSEKESWLNVYQRFCPVTLQTVF